MKQGPNKYNLIQLHEYVHIHKAGTQHQTHEQLNILKQNFHINNFVVGYFWFQFQPIWSITTFV